MSGAVPCSPAEAAAAAREWRKAAGEPGLHPVTIKARLELAAEYQAMATTGNLEPVDGKNADGPVDW